MIHKYYKVKILTALSDDTLDEDGNVTEVGQKTKVINALLSLGRQSGLPHQITHLRAKPGGQTITVEMETPTSLTKAQACTKLAELLPWTSQQISNNTIFTKQGPEEARQDITDNPVEWGEEVI